MQLAQYKPYRLRIKGRDPIALSEARGEHVNKWWMQSKPSEKLALTNDKGEYQETILSSQIEGIERKTPTQQDRDEHGRIGEQGFRCQWGSWHPLADVKKESCECWARFGVHYSTLWESLKAKYPQIHTCTDITPVMQQEFLITSLTSK